MSPAQTAELRAQIDELDWYHTLELAPGLETPGWFDLREIAKRMPMPASLEGARCLDIGTFDGFWAFEMERRGAAEVIAIDILDPERWDWPAGSEQATLEAIGRRKALGRGFEIARDALGSKVERRALSIYELDPAEIGTFDLIYLGSLLLHLRNPIGALAAMRSVCDGRAIVCDAIDGPLSRLFPRRAVVDLDAVGRPWWWKPNLTALVRMAQAAGFELVEQPQRLKMTPGAGQPKRRPSLGTLRHHTARAELLRAWLGDPHAILHLKPAPTGQAGAG